MNNGQAGREKALGKFEECFHFLTFLQLLGCLVQGNESTRAIIYFFIFDLFHLLFASRLLGTRRQEYMRHYLLFLIFE